MEQDYLPFEGTRKGELVPLQIVQGELWRNISYPQGCFSPEGQPSGYQETRSNRDTDSEKFSSLHSEILIFRETL
jgi:hypothetical protein